MIRNKIIITVNDVEASSKWYQDLLNFSSSHGGKVFNILVDENGTVILNLHIWGEHEHPTLKDPTITPGNGLILYIRVDDLDKIWKNAQKLNAVIEEQPHLNENSGKKEFSLRDPDGYYLIISL